MWGQKAELQKLSQAVSNALMAQFQIDPQVVAGLRCLEKGGRFGGNSVRYMRIVDPALIVNKAVAQKYDAPENYQEAMLFDGHTGSDGTGRWYAHFRQPGAHPKFATRST